MLPCDWNGFGYFDSCYYLQNSVFCSMVLKHQHKYSIPGVDIRMTVTEKFSPGLNDLTSETANSPGPFRNANMSKAAQTHKLRKLRAPSKCRECDSLVVFHGAECEEVSWKVV